MAEMQEEVSELISTLASIKLDSTPGPQRKEVVKQAEDLLTKSDNNEIEDVQMAQEIFASLALKPGA